MVVRVQVAALKLDDEGQRSYLGIEMSNRDERTEGDVGKGVCVAFVVQTLLELRIRLEIKTEIPHCS